MQPPHSLTDSENPRKHMKFKVGGSMVVVVMMMIVVVVISFWSKQCETYISLWWLDVGWKVASGGWCEIIDSVTRLNSTHDSAEYCAAEPTKDNNYFQNFIHWRDLFKSVFPSRWELKFEDTFGNRVSAHT